MATEGSRRHQQWLGRSTLATYRKKVLSSALIVVLGFSVSGPGFSQSTSLDERERISAFPCIVCAAGGDVLGILPGGQGRAVKRFDAFKEFCVSDYRYHAGELLVRFKLEGEIWPKEEAWALQADSWQAICRSVTW